MTADAEARVLSKIPMLQAILASYSRERVRLQRRIDILECQVRELRQQLHVVRERAHRRRAL